MDKISFEEGKLNYVLFATDIASFYKEIKDLDCFTDIKYFEDGNEIYVIFSSSEIAGYGDPITGLCQLLYEKGSEWVHGVEEECEPGTKCWWY